ncbi:MAG: heavy-metal-associated domain-containing protein [Thainema sp.]
MTFKVPTITCKGCAETITEASKVVDSDAKVDVDIEKKEVNIESKASEESFREAIVASGHTVES